MAERYSKASKLIREVYRRFVNGETVARLARDKRMKRIEIENILRIRMLSRWKM